MHDVDGLNSGYARLLLEQYLESPETVPDEWRSLFESGVSELVASHPGLARLLEALRAEENGHLPAPAPAAPVEEAPRAERPDDELIEAVATAVSLVKAYRTHGHLAARLDPLGSDPVGDPALEPESLKLTPELQKRIPASVLRVHVPGETLADVLPHLREIYCGTMAYEIEHISNFEVRVWRRKSIESGRFRTPLGPDKKRQLLARLSEVEGLEHYLRRTFLDRELLLAEKRAAEVVLQTFHLAQSGKELSLLVGAERRPEAAGLDRLAQPDALLVVRDVLDLVGHRPAVDLAQVREHVGEGLPRHVYAQDRCRDPLLQLRGQLQALRLERGIADRIRPERIESGGEVAVRPVGLDEGDRRGDRLDQLVVGPLGARCLFDGGGGRGRRQVAVLLGAQRLEQPGEAGVACHDLAVAALEETPPFVGDGLRALEVLLEQEPGVARIQPIDVVHAHYLVL